MSKKSRNLRLTLWQEIVYFLLVAVAPAIVTGLEVFSSHSTIFKITFSSVGCVLLLIIVLRKFVFRAYIDKCHKEIALLEHDYSIGVGDDDLCKRKWTFYNIIIYVYSVVVLLFSSVLAYLLITAVSQQILQFRGAALFMLLFVLIGILFKLFCYIIMYKSTMKDGDVDEG